MSTNRKKLVCPKCGTEMPSFANYCKYCGTALEKEVQAQQSDNNTDWRTTYKPVFYTVCCIIGAIIFLLDTCDDDDNNSSNYDYYYEQPSNIYYEQQSAPTNTISSEEQQLSDEVERTEKLLSDAQADLYLIAVNYGNRQSTEGMLQCDKIGRATGQYDYACKEYAKYLRRVGRNSEASFMESQAQKAWTSSTKVINAYKMLP